MVTVETRIEGATDHIRASSVKKGDDILINGLWCNVGYEPATQGTYVVLGLQARPGEPDPQTGHRTMWAIGLWWLEVEGNAILERAVYAIEENPADGDD